MTQTIGLIGSGMLGAAMARGWLDSGTLTPESLLIATRSGTSDVPGVEVVTDPQALVSRCDALLLCVPPDALPNVKMHAPNLPILSVVAGATQDRLSSLFGSARIIRAMSSPAAAQRLAFSPWIASAASTAADRHLAQHLFGALGKAAEVTDEHHIDVFTALTGPVPGFVAACAAAMSDHARSEGVPEEIANAAVRQLFLASGIAMADDPRAPEAMVQDMIDYAGTTAAGLTVLRDGPMRDALADGLRAATKRAKTIAE
ncbi:NAD(P)-binding domain-containing protein [Sagittula sp. NFXS13]|uniref:pyrroline-5-carboxylate reductase family protein n=1 Tax=Sagittula sp. NFXS13 TaxID=2819095 RepID=UPI0032E001B1